MALNAARRRLNATAPPPPIDGPRNPDAVLIALSADLEACHQRGGPTAMEDRRWWDTVVAISSSAATTREGLRAKASAVRTVLVSNGGDDCPQVTAMLASLLTDMLGERVRLPGMDSVT